MRDISKTFPGVKALQHVDFTLRKGEIHALMGENGAGKTTFTNLLSGLFVGKEGEILLNGIEISQYTKADLTKFFGVIHQDFHLFPMSVRDNIRVGEELSEEERRMLSEIPFDEERYKQAIGVRALKGEKGYSTIERNSCRPSFDVCGIWGGYTGEGSKTVLPSKAYAKVSCRLVPHQQHEKISRMFVDYIESIVPDYVQVKVTPMHGGEGYVCPITLPAYKAAEEGFTKAFGRKPLAVRRGGSIPIISDFEKILGTKTVLMGFGLESNAIHSPNENFPLDMFRKGIEAVVEFHESVTL